MDNGIFSQSVFPPVIQAFEQALERDVMTLPVNIILYANDMILQRQKELGNKMKTTAAVVRIDDTWAHIAHVGDSRVYAFKDAKVVFQTLDHTAAQMSVEVGEITPQEIRSHPDRCVLTKALGSSDELRPSLTQLPKDSFDCILMCTDGFWGSVTEKDMCNCLSQSRSPQQWLELMQEIRDKNFNKLYNILLKDGYAYAEKIVKCTDGEEYEITEIRGPKASGFFCKIFLLCECRNGKESESTALRFVKVETTPVRFACQCYALEV